LGSPLKEPDRSDDETQRKVDFPQGFWLAQHPVNQQQWQAVMGNHPSREHQGDLFPVDSVTWIDAQEFCQQTGLRLPSEAEWEYACRAGTTTPFGIGGGQCLNAQMANFDGNYPYGCGHEAFEWLRRHRTVPQGCFPPNAWGLHEMHGQVWEWCEDVMSGRDRFSRGGGWYRGGGGTRAASRLSRGGGGPDAFPFSFDPDYRRGSFGVRPCSSSTSSSPKPEAPSALRSRAGSEARGERNDRPAQW
jgi:formylglycine-generating enzyme required for sulfatase activity